MNKITQLRQMMAMQQIEALLISTQANVYYISGFYSEAGVATILLTQKDAYLMSDGRFMTEAKEATDGFEVVRWKDDMFQDLGKLMDDLHIQNVFVDDDSISYAQARTLMANTKAILKPAPKMIERMRSIKTKEELEIIQKACEIADEAFVEILKYIRPGVSEAQVRNELEFQMRKRGAENCSFETIVASGTRGALPHGVASEKIIEKGDMVTMDFGALYHHYCSDITRTVAIGQPDEELIKIYQIVKDTQAIMAQHLKAGIVSHDLEKIGRDYIEAHGYELIHGPGHSFGLEIHESPFISSKSDEIFEENVVVTLEPGIYVPGLGGIRIEDDFLVQKDGCIQLTHANKDLIILPE